MAKKYTGNNYKCITIKGKQIRLHRYVMEQYLGRKLSYDECVHHLNHDITDNRIENLVIVSREEHAKLHPEGLENSRIARTKNIPVQEIKSLHYKVSFVEISNRYEISLSTVSRIMKGERK